MNPQDPLASLHPLREPELIGWWPLAPGWWVLLIGGSITVITLLYLLHKRYKKNAYRRVALRQLQALQAAHQKNGNSAEFLGQLNALLKSVALHAYRPDEIAACHGESWRLFLNRDLPADAHFEPQFDNAVYQRTCPDIDIAHAERAAQRWIRKHRVAS